MHKRTPLAMAAMLAFAACSREPTGVTSNELLLAQSAQSIAHDVAASRDGGTTHGGWIRRLVEALRTTDDPEARAFLEQARAYRDSARAAFEDGDRAAARNYARLSFRSVLAAVIELYPDASERTGLAVDQAIERIESFLGDREAPRIRAILAHVEQLRATADEALAAGDAVTALALNLRGMQILYRLVNHVRERYHDHDEVADAEMNDVGY